MPRKSPYEIVLSSGELRELHRRTTKYTLPYFMVIRAKVILLAAEGYSNDGIAVRLNTRREDRYLLEHPEILEQIPDNAEIYFLPEEDPDLLQENLRIAETQKGEGRRVVLVRIGKLSPPRSCLQDVRLESLTL